MRTRWKPLVIAVTDFRKIIRERRTIVLTILFPVVVVIVVGTTFSLGYHEFEKKELAVGIVSHRQSQYTQMIVDAVKAQGATARVYPTVEEARSDLIDEKIDTVIEIDPWIDEKMREFKRSWIAIHADETRPLLTAANEVVMLEAKVQAVDEMVWNYTQRLTDEVVPRIHWLLDRLDKILEGEENEEIQNAISVLSPIDAIQRETVELLANATLEAFRAIEVNGTPQQRLLLSMLNKSAIVGTIDSLVEAKPLLDACYNFLVYVYPFLERGEDLPAGVFQDLSSLEGNLSAIDPSQATLVRALLPSLRGKIVSEIKRQDPDVSPEEAERRADLVISGVDGLMAQIASGSGVVDSLLERVRTADREIESLNLTQLSSEGRNLLDSLAGMEKYFVTSPLYIVEKPLYFPSGRRRYVDYISPGIFAFGILFSVLVYTVLSVVRDREKGILRRIFTCNVDRWTYVGGKTIVCMGIAAAQILILTACAIGLFHIYVASIPKTLLMGVYSSIGFVGLGLLISSVSRTELEALTTSFALCFIMLIISGIFYPFELSPSIVRQASWLVPITYVSDLLKVGIIKNAPLSDVAWEIVLIGAYGAVTLITGILAFSWRKKG